MIAIPTAGGKTVIFASLAASIEGRVLIVVPSKELREQAYDKIKAIDESIDVGNVQATLDEVHSKIVIASRQSLTHKKSSRIKRMLEHGNFEYVIIDEAHQAIDQIKKIVDRINKNAKIIGFTATPYNKDMSKVFKKIDYQKHILEMIYEGYLCEPKAIMVESSTNLNSVKIVAGEFNQKELEEVVNNIERNQLVVKAYKKYAKDRKSTIVFATGIEHSNSLAREFNRNGIYCKSIDSTMSTEEREKILEEFKSGKLPVIVNVAVLTTGFDHPDTDCIILARPTKSRVLYVQIIGRGLRLSNKKNDCLIIDINDVVRSHDLMSISSVFDMPIKHGETPRQAIERIKIEKQQEEERRRLEQIRLEELKRKQEEEIKLRARQIKLFNKEMMDKFKECKYDWFNVDILSYALTYELDKHYVIEKEGDGENLVFHCYRVSTSKENKFAQRITSHNELDKLIDHVENKLILRPSTYVRRDSEWKSQPPTENQLKYIHWVRTKWEAHVYFTKNSIKSVMKKYRNQNIWEDDADNGKN